MSSHWYCSICELHNYLTSVRCAIAICMHIIGLINNTQIHLSRSVMVLKLKVPDIACDDCAAKITQSIHVMEPNALVDVDVQDKTVTVQSSAAEESIKQVIVAAGFHIEGY